jgi:hypothetical protein
VSALLQAITCKACKGSYLVGINHKDIRKVEKSSGQLGNDPWIGIGHEQIEHAPEINEGDKIPCPHCSDECTVRDMWPVGEKDDNLSDNE